ncbi:predicted protein [Nematostella vectensis]|uniref:tRNA(Phe) (4-demethylwyosine(37)-C(7)) aminocarboxypropyltransferase n=1 Tax=Nematostella vectensis TaxID=45351 RepID=A7RKB2_NEMVE|nr:predicted protein [Nematostella vectensis]|eukprot:XP_001640200.1 predicted protein [Nematostella vectensis]
MQFDHSRFPDEKLSPRKLMLSKLKALLVVAGVDWSKELEMDIPYRWEQHGDLIIIPENCFISDVWLSALGSGFWVSVASALGAKRLAKASCVENNSFRSPRVTLLVGTNSWVSHIDNGITYMFDVTKCMFSSGNITEKMRVAKMDCLGQVIVDLFAGIGYFVLPFLVHANAAFVHACEWNPHAVEALRRNLVQNKVNEKCEVHFGDNRKFPYKGIADHVNLGLIPSSEFAWPVACRSLRSDVGGWLHIHGNISSADSKNSHLDGLPFPPTCNKRIRKAWLDWSNTVASKIKILLQHEHLAIFNWTVDAQHIEHVKSYAPHIDHLVLDLECRPVCTN